MTDTNGNNHGDDDLPVDPREQIKIQNEKAQALRADGNKNKNKGIYDKFPFLKDKRIVAAIILILALLIGGVSYALISGKSDDNAKDKVVQPTENVVPKRAWSDDTGQTQLATPQIIDGVGKGTITTVDNQQNQKKVSAPMVGIDGVGSQKGATLAPPEDISKVGYYIRSAPFGSKNKGSSVITSHIDYNGVVGYGSIFTSLKKGDPITVTNQKGEAFHYVVNEDPVNVNKSDSDYVKKTMGTINKMKGSNELVLVTCGGQFLGAGSPLGYADNIVVTAKPVSKKEVEKAEKTQKSKEKKSKSSTKKSKTSSKKKDDK